MRSSTLVETLTQVVETLDIEHEALMGSDAERSNKPLQQSARHCYACSSKARTRKLGLKESLRAQIESHPACSMAYVIRALVCVDELREKVKQARTQIRETECSLRDCVNAHDQPSHCYAQTRQTSHSTAIADQLKTPWARAYWAAPKRRALQGCESPHRLSIFFNDFHK